MTDRMDQIITAAVRQGFAARQTRTGTWVFSKGITTLVFHHTPRTSREWMWMINALRGAGLRFPPRGE
ncbi:hypothetical protein [Rhizomonospora bruguierae]|uniref:hypothetical protein n=1 Tax=Rhizomonospora bruguierae TaxID=1581705 RepID=UPI001BD143EB|nr:hypothetical protein [Micromonospora sp. NBRC 107566]